MLLVPFRPRTDLASLPDELPRSGPSCRDTAETLYEVGIAASSQVTARSTSPEMPLYPLFESTSGTNAIQLASLGYTTSDLIFLSASPSELIYSFLFEDSKCFPFQRWLG